MNPILWRRVKAVFDAAFAIDATERAAFLDRECGGDAVLRQQVDTLLESHERAPEFLETPAAFLFDGAPNTDDLIGRTIGTYRLLERIGAGGMGEVYRAEDSKLDRPVALKLLAKRVATDSDRLRRFHAEARAASSLNHPQILVIHDFGEMDGRPFIVTEFVEGQTLRERMTASVVPVGEAVAIALQVAGALAAAHARGLVHRDIKPENVMLRPDGYVKVLDFGLAKLMTPATSASLSDTNPGTVMGTPRYMSPEQARGLDVDARTDIWSLGVMLYEMLAGRPPFDGPTPSDVMAAVLRSDPLLSDSGLAHVPAIVSAVVEQALAKEAGLRYASAADMHKALTAARAALESGAVPAMASAPPTRLVTRLGDGDDRLSLGAGVRSIAVLPFTALDLGDSEAYLGPGLADAVITKLTSIRRISVQPTSAILKYAGADPFAAGSALRVESVLSGTIQKHGDRIRVTTQLVNIELEAAFWGETFDEPFTDIFALEHSISEKVVSALMFTVTGEERRLLAKHHTNNPEAYRWILRGRHFWNKGAGDWFPKAFESFQQAVAADPNDAVAHVGLADCFNMLGFWGNLPSTQAFPSAEASATRALALDESLADAHAALAWSKLHYDYDRAGAEREFMRSLELNPSSVVALQWWALFLTQEGRFDEAIEVMSRAHSLDPLILHSNYNLGVILMLARRDDEAIEQFQKTIELDPGYLMAHSHLGFTYGLKGMREPAMAAQEQVALMARDVLGLRLSGWALLAATFGDRDNAHAGLEELTELAKSVLVFPTSFAQIHAQLAENDAAMLWLERAYVERDPWLVWLKVNPCFDPIRTDARFIDLMKRVGLGDARDDRTIAVTNPRTAPSDEVVADQMPHRRLTTRVAWALTIAVSVAIIVGVAPRLLNDRRHAAPDRAATGAADAATEKSRLVVLPFENLSRNPADDWLAGGFSDTLTYSLQKLRTYTLVSRDRVAEVYRSQAIVDSAPLDLANIGRISTSLGVQYYVHGTYQRVGDQVRVVARLAAANSGEIKAQESVTDSIDNVLRLEDDLASRFAIALEGSPSRVERSRTRSVEAYQAYTDGRAQWEAGRFAAALPMLERAVALDANYEQAWALLSKVHSRLVSPARQTVDEEALRQHRREALRAAERAAALAPTYDDAHTALALAHRANEQVGPWRTEAQRAIELNPQSYEAHVLLGDSFTDAPLYTCRRTPDSALAEAYFRTAMKLDPSDYRAYEQLAAFFVITYSPETPAILKQLFAISPNDLIGQLAQAQLHLEAKQADEAAAMLRPLDHRVLYVQMLDAWLYLVRGNRPAARELFAAAERTNASWPLLSAAQTAFLGGDVETARELVSKAITRDRACGQFMAASKAFVPLRANPSIAALLREQ